MESNKSEYALITGASSGIGLALAELFAKDGAQLFLVAREEEKLRALKTEWELKYKITVNYAAGNLTDVSFRTGLPQRVHQAGGTISVLVNCAGIGRKGPFGETDWGIDEATILLNSVTPTHLIVLFLSDLRERQGSVLNVASLAAVLPGPGMAVYYATKAYLFSLSESLQIELGRQGVSVTCLIPGPTVSGFQKANGMNTLSSKRFPTAHQVAYFGYQALCNKKAVAIHGFRNQLIYLFSKFSPRFVTRFLLDRDR
ncbi:MAG: SDR family NAD(P)-dependent oxidoreductase, partial [Candidatus Moraniibacteriota bacterium]